MDKDIIELVRHLSGNLDNIVKNGIPIKDTFAPITTGVNILTTVLATAFGGWITLQLFKRQEEMRIKQELRLEFFKEYKKLYNDLLDSLIQLEMQTSVVKTISTLSLMSLELKEYKNQDNKIIIDYATQKHNLEKVMEITEHVCYKLERVCDYIELNKMIMGDYEGDTYSILNLKIFILREDIFSLKHNYSDIDKYNSELINTTEQRREEIVTYNKVLIYDIKGQDIEVKDLLESAKNIHLDIEEEFIGQYFK